MFTHQLNFYFNFPKNPQGITIKSDSFFSAEGMKSNSYPLPEIARSVRWCYALNFITSKLLDFFGGLTKMLKSNILFWSFGVWKLVAKYKNTPQKNFTTEFEVAEYGKISSRDNVIIFIHCCLNTTHFILKCCRASKWLWNQANRSSMWTRTSWQSILQLSMSGRTFFIYLNKHEFFYVWQSCGFVGICLVIRWREVHLWCLGS